ncbi:aldehyde reductase [Fusarium pseudocircinatum]|uniref:Aldehyde reductase n=1 Tax=Fusarium pseudocircinatum TaxID=56676 RepID=A0A8H5KJV6_9HYPO|nr:aldehyde reductase [Fusarium pseudocircinatum]
MTGIKVVLGSGAFWTKDQWTAAGVKTYLDALAAGGVKEIDSAQAYGDSELVLGDNGAPKKFEVSTKLPVIMDPGSYRRDEVVTRTQKSLERLRVDQVDILYLHSPDPSIPIEETLAGIQGLYLAGAFRRFGLSNYTTDEVRKIHDLQRAKGWVLPIVYQGNYNPVARTYEQDLIPTLRELGIAFYAYSPAAGGFLAKSKEQVLAGVGRFAKDGGLLSDLYNTLYSRPSLLDALPTWQGIARDAGCSPYDLAIRWVAFNSVLKPDYGDAVIIGPSNVERLQWTLDGVGKGPLADEIVQRIDTLWDSVKHEAPKDNISELFGNK